MNKRRLCGLNCEEIAGLIESGGYDYDHAVKIVKSLYGKRISDFTKIRGIPKSLMNYLDDHSETGLYGPALSETSADGTIKYLFISPEGKQFESVYIPEIKRKTICVSTQSGCRMGCPFCVTGKYGFHGDLTAGDIVNQVISIPFQDKITHVVFMGMGEPMDNLKNVLKACQILSAEWGLAISQRNITVSTVGITPAIREFLQASDCNLALSLYSPFPGERIRVIPAEKAYPAREIINIMSGFPLSRRRRLTVAYVMISGVNDTGNHLSELISIFKNTGIRVNLLAYHTIKDDHNKASSDERLQFFKHNLVMEGISASVRKSRGTDISAACGLLASGLR